MTRRNNLNELSNHLFEAMERLNDEELNGRELEEELERAKGISGLAGKIIDNGHLALQVCRFKDDRMDIDRSIPDLLLEE